MKKLKVVRLSKGLTQKALSERSGVNLRTIQDYESNGGQVIDKANLRTLLNLAKALGCNIKDILEDVELVELYEEMKNLTPPNKGPSYVPKQEVTIYIKELKNE